MVRLPDGIRVRPCTTRHILGLCLLNAAVFPPKDKISGEPLPAWRLPGYLASNAKSLRERLQLNHVMVATRGIAVLGSVEVHTTSYLRKEAPMLTEEQADQLQPYLSSLAVREDVRGCGLGRALVQAAVDESVATARPGEALLLQVESNNTAAVELYHQCGFETISHPWCQISLMRRPLREELGETSRHHEGQHEQQEHEAERDDGEPPLQRRSGPSVGSVSASAAIDASSGASADGSNG